MSAPEVPDALVDKAARAIDADMGWHGVGKPNSYSLAKARVALAAVWADIRLPDPTGGCVCSFESEDRGGGHSELVQEYEPACPEHSEHVYDPVLGMWVLRDQVSKTRPERPVEQADVKAVQPGEGGFF